MQIENFYPKYPNIRPFKDGNLNPYDSRSFETVIASKKEFVDLKLASMESVPTTPGDQMNHQKYISRFMSSYTGYDEMLIFNEMGTGKTCTAIACIEKLRYEPRSHIKGALVLAKGNGLLKNFVQELLFTCTDGRYVPDNYNQLSDLERVHRTNKITSQFYEFHTFETFAKKISRMSVTTMRTEFDNYIIVIDEVHNLREKEETISDRDSGDDIVVADNVDIATATVDDDNYPLKKAYTRKPKGGGGGDALNMYKEIYKFLHTIRNRKILLMSGTVMKDGPEEFASVLNLILPESNQFVTDRAFLRRYFIDGSIRSDKIDEMKEKIKGRVSYLKAGISEVKKIFRGETIGRLKYFKVFPNRMSAFQTNAYLDAYRRDTTDTSIFINSRQASLFVYPDGSYGAAGFNQPRFIQKQIIARPGGVGGSDIRTEYVLGKEMIDAIGNPNQTSVDDRLKNLYRYSAKYADTIRILLENPNKKSFIYCQYVNGSGAILLGKLLELFGYSRATGSDRTVAKRFALITNQSSSVKTQRALINRFNDTNDNVDGQIISVVIGSRVINEGFTLKNVSNIIILTAHWNYSETAQAIARGWRFGSHRELLARRGRGGALPVVNVYQMVAIPGSGGVGGVKSIDLEMYETSETKDVVMKQIERVVKESAIDCPLAYDRNLITGYDGQRECDYTSCAYQCTGVEPVSKLDVSTYNIYYAQTRVLNEYLKEYFKTNFYIGLSELYLSFSDLDTFEILNVISKLIDRNEKYYNKYGFVSFLRIRNDILFITSDVTNDTTTTTTSSGSVSLDDYYAKNIILENGDSFKTIVDGAYQDILPEKIRLLFSKDTPKDMITTTLGTFPKEVQREILKGCIEARETGRRRNADERDEILKYFKGFYSLDGGAAKNWIVWLYSDDLGVECFVGGRWVACSRDLIPKKTVEYSKSPIGYYGLYNPQLQDFCIRAIPKESEGEITDLRRVTIGRRCIDWERERLVDIVANEMKIPPPDATMFKDLSIGELQARLKTYARDKLKTKADKYILPEYYQDLDSMKRILYWSTPMRSALCERMKEWFDEKGLLEENFECGHQKKKRGGVF